MRNKPALLKVLLEKGAKLDYNTVNILALDKISQMTDEIKAVIEEYKYEKRIMPFLKFHKMRDSSKYYPEGLK